MEIVGSDVLLDPAFTVPAVPEAPAGVGWLRCMVVRFCEGEVHARRRALTEHVIARVGRPQWLSSPAAMLALIGRLKAGDGAPAVPTTRRVTADGHEVLVDLAAAPFGAGRHACPGQTLALHLAAAGHPRQPGL